MRLHDAIIVAGVLDVQHGGSGSSDIFVAKLNPSNGAVIWTQTYGGQGDEQFGGLRETADGGYVVCGTTSSYGAGSYDICLLRLDSAGNLLWQRTYGGADNDRAGDVALADNGGYVVAGSTVPSGSRNSSIWVIKTAPDPVLATEPNATSLTERFDLYPNFPNPFNPSTQISFDLPTTGHVLLKVFDITGRQVEILTDGLMSAGHHQLSFDGHTFSSGVYFYQLTHDRQTQTRKMLLLK
jgi:hypothetical protein